MEEIFVKKLIINELLNIRDFEIPISETEKKHLIITGKNGSGKTTLLNEIKLYLSKVINNNQYEIQERSQLSTANLLANDTKQKFLSEVDRESYIQSLKKSINWFKVNGRIKLFFNTTAAKLFNSYSDGNFVISHFEAKRNTLLNMPSGINKVNIKPYYKIEENAGIDFIQYIVNLKADKSFAKDDNELDEAKKIDDWFGQFESRILEIFETNGAHLQFDRKSYNFNIIEPGKEPYNLNQLSDGYSSILRIITELIMRMEQHKTKNYDLQGIVLIDEIETHLHISLQKKVLPFLISFFPKIQFIVTTHSPFVITSVNNAVVCDLERKIVIDDDLSGYSYDAIVEGYYDMDKYSGVLKAEVAEYETLMDKDELTVREKIKLEGLKEKLENIPKILSNELVAKLQQISLKHLNKKKQL